MTNDSGFIANISTFDTDDLTEGTTNQYDKTVSLTGGTDISVTGTYPSFTINSTNTGGSASPNMISGGILSNNSTNSDEVIDISAVIARSNSDIQDISISAGNLNITTNASWASGTAPSLTDASIHVWGDYNSGTPRFILDNSTGSNISGAKRRIGSFITDADGDIIPFKMNERAGGGTKLNYVSSILDSSSITTTATLITLSVPLGIVMTAMLNIHSTANSGGNFTGLIYSNGDNTRVGTFPDGGIGGAPFKTIFTAYTNTSAQIYESYFNEAPSDHRLETYGFIDERIA